MFEDLLRSQKLQRSQNSRARQIIVSQIETQNPPESRSTIELKVIVDGPHTTNKVGDNSILQSNQEGPTPLPGIHGVNYPKPTGTELQKYHFKWSYYTEMKFWMISSMKDEGELETFIPEDDPIFKNQSKKLFCRKQILFLLSLLILFS